jgi:hypothetical protein
MEEVCNILVTAIHVALILRAILESRLRDFALVTSQRVGRGKQEGGMKGSNTKPLAWVRRTVVWPRVVQITT